MTHANLGEQLICTLFLLRSQEITLEEYERQMAEKKAALNKVAEVKQVSLDDFKGMKPHARKEEDEIPGLSLTVSKKKETKPKEETPKEKPKKQVSRYVNGRGEQLAECHTCLALPDSSMHRGGRSASLSGGRCPALGWAGHGYAQPRMQGKHQQAVKMHRSVRW
jgi:hypothetical protein